MIRYVEHRFSDGHMNIIMQALGIIERHRRQGFTLTLRQLYYQFVKLGDRLPDGTPFPNDEKSYKKLGGIIKRAREAGLVDWEHIEDRSRSISYNTPWDSPVEMLENIRNWYHIDLWQDQQHRPEVWCEKDALIGIIASACGPLDVTYFACRGYVSASEQWRSAMRIRQTIASGQIPVILYLGDHDPSGIDMTRDHLDRLRMFNGGTPIEVRRLALNYDQVLEFNPAPNPAKLTDSRAKEYIKRYGRSSWELDALDPSDIVDLVQRTILSMRDDDLFARYQRKKQAESDLLSEAAQVAIDYLEDKNDGIVELED